MSKYTPGPWVVRVDGMFLRVIHGEHKTTVAANIPVETNARLISAAPDLLGALELMLSTHEWTGVTNEAKHAARAAIAKAKGAA